MKSWILPLLLIVSFSLQAEPKSRIKFPLSKKAQLRKAATKKKKVINKKDNALTKPKNKITKLSDPKNKPANKPKRNIEKIGEVIKVETTHSAKPLPKKSKVWLDFNKTALVDVVKWFSEKLSKNFIVQDRISKGKVTIMSPKPVTIREAYRTFLTILSVHNVSVVDDGKFTIVMSEKDVKSKNIPYYKDGKAPNLFKMVATVLKFKYSEAKNINRVIKIFKDNAGKTHVFDDKTLIVIDYAANIKKMKRIIEDIDQPRALADTPELYFINLEHMAPSDAKKMIEKIFKPFDIKNRKRSKKKNTTKSRKRRFISCKKQSNKK